MIRVISYFNKEHWFDIRPDSIVRYYNSSVQENMAIIELQGNVLVPVSHTAEDITKVLGAMK